MDDLTRQVLSVIQGFRTFDSSKGAVQADETAFHFVIFPDKEFSSVQFSIQSLVRWKGRALLDDRLCQFIYLGESWGVSADSMALSLTLHFKKPSGV